MIALWKSVASTQNVAFVLFDLILNVPSTIFQLCRERSSWVEPAQAHNAVNSVRLEPAAPRSRVKHSTTKLLHTHQNVARDKKQHIYLSFFLQYLFISFYKIYKMISINKNITDISAAKKQEKPSALLQFRRKL